MFIVIEGADGTGKSTLAAALAQHLNATLTAEPSRALIGQWVRANLDALPAVALAFLFAADRAQHVSEVIAPALARGGNVICDRYIPSSVAYQGLDAIALNTSFPVPDLTILLTASPRVARQRIAARDALTPFEARHADELPSKYIAALNALGWRYVVIDAGAGVEQVLSKALAHVAKALDWQQDASTTLPMSVASPSTATPRIAPNAPLDTMALLLTARDHWACQGVIVVTPPIAASHGEPWRATIVNYLGDHANYFTAPTEDALYRTLIEMAP